MCCGVRTELTQGLEAGPGGFDGMAALVKERPAFFYGSGTHRMDGILIGSGEGLGLGGAGVPTALTDLAPMILRTMGLTAPDADDPARPPGAS